MNRKSIKQLNQEAGELAAHYWLDASESILKGGRNPAPLSHYSRHEFSNDLLPEYFHNEAHKANPRWWVSDKNFKHVRNSALLHAKLALTTSYGAEKWPLTLAHFSRAVPGNVNA